MISPYVFVAQLLLSQWFVLGFLQIYVFFNFPIFLHKVWTFSQDSIAVHILSFEAYILSGLEQAFAMLLFSSCWGYEAVCKVASTRCPRQLPKIVMKYADIPKAVAQSHALHFRKTPGTWNAYANRRKLSFVLEVHRVWWWLPPLQNVNTVWCCAACGFVMGRRPMSDTLPSTSGS